MYKGTKFYAGFIYLCLMNMFEDKELKTTQIETLGEFGFIDHLTRGVKIKNPSTIFGIGDDAAVIDIGNKYHLLSTDLLIEGVHFDLAYMPLKHLGYKSVSVNVSDICSMNGNAKQITVGIAMSNRFTVEAIEEIYDGIHLACKHYGVDLVGGDTTSSTSGLMIGITVLGEVETDRITYRSGAKVHDLLVCTGDLGAAYLGLELLNRENAMFKDNPKMHPDLSGNDYVLRRQLKPEAGVKYIKMLKEQSIIPTSMIDISDGLSSEALHISKSSNVGITIHEDKIPIDYAAANLANELNINPTTCALNGGEDYELLFTVNQDQYGKLKNSSDFTIIGFVTDVSEGNNFIANDGSTHPLTAQGWDAMKKT